MNLLTDIQYFAPVVLYSTLSKCSNCVFDQYEAYRKMSFRNRCTLLGGNGPINLSIPLVGGRGQKALMKDVRILNTGNWQAQHWKTIISCYNKSPWFEYYKDELEKIYNKKFELLMDWNLTCFRWVADKMSINVSVSLTGGPVNDVDNLQFEDWRSRLLPSTINRLFPESGRYPQVFEDRFGFVPNLSILDLLFCQGPAALE